MQKRLCGREQEFGMFVWPTVPNPDQEDVRRRFICEKIIREIRENLKNYSFSSHYGQIWLGNGAKVYIDNSCLEYSGPECPIDTSDAVSHEKASELLLNEALAKVAADSAEKIVLFKNNFSLRAGKNRLLETAHGSHHNYSHLSEKQNRIFSFMANFIPISLPFTGNGHIGASPMGEIIYLISQRVARIKMSSGSTAESLVNNRYEPHMDSGLTNLSRLHITSRDAVRCEFQIWLTDIITHLVLRLAEEDSPLPPERYLLDPLMSLKTINGSFQRKLDCSIACGGFMGAPIVYRSLWEHNEFFLSAAKQLNPLSDMEKKGLQEWERVLELLKAKAFDKLVGELDWATKWFLLRSKMKKRGFGLDSLPAWKINMNYHNISSSPDESWFARLDQDGYIKHLVSQEDVLKAQTTPPETRAKSRGELIVILSKHPELEKLVRSFDWSLAAVKTPPPNPLSPLEGEGAIFFGERNDPFSPASSTLEEFRSLWLKPN